MVVLIEGRVMRVTRGDDKVLRVGTPYPGVLPPILDLIHESKVAGPGVQPCWVAPAVL